MPRPKKERPDPHIVFVDTSSLFFEDKGPPVDPAFDKFWTRYCSGFDLELRIPEVVRGELLYQQCARALDSLARANENMGKVSHVTRKEYSHRVSQDRVCGEIERKLESWISAQGAKLLKTPTNSIRWSEVIEKSIWRRPPFSDQKTEKGFRDCMIMETIIHSCANERSQKQIVFLCKDKGLRSAVDDALAFDDRYVSFEFIADLQSYLDLKNQELESKFIRKITERAQQKFFAPNDESCLVARENLPALLRERYEQYFKDPLKSDKSMVAFAGLLGSSPEWHSMQDGRFWVARPQFLEKNAENEYVWLTVIQYVEQYRRVVDSTFQPSAIPVEHRVLVLPFHIKWFSKVTSDARFLSTGLVGTELVDNDFRSPTDEEKRSWDLGDS